MEYSVFFKEGDEANDSLLTKDEAMNLAKDLEKEGYEVIVARLLSDEWETIYVTK